MEIEKRIGELEKELQARQQRVQRAQQMVSQETQAIISISGGIAELRRLLMPSENAKISPGKKKQASQGLA